MSCLLLLLVVALPQPNPVAFAPLDTRPRTTVDETQDHWLAMDKFWHFTASFATFGATYHLCANRFEWTEPAPTGIAAGGTIALGLTKELADIAGPKKHFSWKDLAADALGIAAGYLVFVHDYER